MRIEMCSQLESRRRSTVWARGSGNWTTLATSAPTIFCPNCSRTRLCQNTRPGRQRRDGIQGAHGGDVPAEREGVKMAELSTGSYRTGDCSGCWIWQWTATWKRSSCRRSWTRRSCARPRTAGLLSTSSSWSFPTCYFQRIFWKEWAFSIKLCLLKKTP